MNLAQKIEVYSLIFCNSLKQFLKLGSEKGITAKMAKSCNVLNNS